MPTPSTDASLQQHQQHQLQQERTARAGSPDAGGDTSDTMRFRAPTLEEAIALAETSLGARVRVVAANRIRRGGIGGFFASDLGVEATVALDDETMEQALERIVAESAADERAQFESRLAQQLGVRPASLGTAAATPTAPVPVVSARPSTQLPGIGGRFDQRDDEPTPAVNPVLSEVLAALMAEAAEQQQAQQAQQAERAAASTRAAEEQARADERERAIAAELATAFAAAARAAEQQVDGDRHDESAMDAPSAPAVSPTMMVAPSTVADTTRRPVYDTPPTMVRVEQIIEELSAITAEPVFGGDRGRGRVARPIGVQRAADDAGEAGAAAAAQPAQAAHADAATAASGASTVHDIPAAAPQALPATPVAERPKVLPTLPPRPGEIARAASAASAANHTRALSSPANLVAPARRSAPASAPAFAAAGPAATSPWPGRVPAPQTQAAVRPIPTLPASTAAAPDARDAVDPSDLPDLADLADLSERLEPTVPGADDQAEMARMAESVRRALRGDHDPGLVSAVDRDAAEGTVHASLEIDADLLDGSGLADRPDDRTGDRAGDRGRQITSSRVPGSSSAPSRRQVELAVAATDQLIESLKRDDGVKRLSVRVVLRTGDQREVEAEAEWEAS